MEDTDLDITQFENDLTNQYLVGAARARMFEEIVANNSWNADFKKCLLEIGSKKYTIQILGTYADEYFLWGWANPNARDWTKSLDLANKLQVKGREPGYAVFKERRIAPTWITPEEIAYVAGELLGGYPAHFVVQEKTLILVLVINSKTNIMDFPVSYISGLLLDMPPTIPNPRSAVSCFIDKLGFVVTEKTNSIFAEREDACFTATFNKDDRVKDVSLQTFPTKPTSSRRKK